MSFSVEPSREECHTDASTKSSEDALARHYQSILQELGEDPSREGLLKTPARAAKAMLFLTQGYSQSVEELLNGAVFHEENNQMVVLRDIEFYSQCEHHLVPFFGKCHIAYIPKDGRILGLSKLARIAETFAKRLQVQERLTAQIANTLYENLQPRGVMVVIEAEHTCMTLRGVKKPGAKTITSVVLGAFREKPQTRAEAMALIKG